MSHKRNARLIWVNVRNLMPHKLSSRLLVTVCLLGIFSRSCWDLLTFSMLSFQKKKKKKKKKKDQEHFQCVKWFKSRTGPVLIWFQTVYKGYQQTIKVAASKEKVKINTHYFLNLRQAGYPEKTRKNILLTCLHFLLQQFISFSLLTIRTASANSMEFRGLRHW